MIDKFYTQKEITDILGISRSRIQQWMQYSYMAPSIVKSVIQGERNQWSFSDMVKLASFNQVLKNGLSRSCAADLIKADHIYMSVSGKQEKRRHPWKFIGSKECHVNNHPIFIALQNGDEKKNFCVLFEDKGHKDHLQVIIESLGFKWEWMVFFDVGEIRDRLALELEWEYRDTEKAGSESLAPSPAH